MVIDLLANLLLVVGTVFLLSSALGVLRFPDFYTRLHAAGKGDTLGQAMVLVGLILKAGPTLIAVKLLFIVLFVLIFNPTATHALARGAWIAGLRPWTGEKERPFVQREGQIDDAEREAILAEGKEDAGETAKAEARTEGEDGDA